MHPLTDKAKGVIDSLLAAFSNPETLVDTVAKISLIPNTSPCCHWSPCNRFIVALHCTSDARGFRQWKEVDRQVVKGAKAFNILVPRFKNIKNEEADEKQQALIGFVSAAVFAIEDTDGVPLPEAEPPVLPQLRIVADHLGIPVTYAGAASDRIAGVYTHKPSDDNGETGRITLYSHGVAVFYHELAHALHHRTGKIRNGKSQDDVRANEVVAEVGAAVLVRIFEGQEMGGQALTYIHEFDAKESHLIRLLPEIIEIVDMAIGISASDKTEAFPTTGPVQAAL